MKVVPIIFAVGWVGFGAYWLSASFSAKPSGDRRRGRWGRFLAVRVVLALLVVLLVRRGVLHPAGVVSNPALQAVGLAAFAAGLGLAVWARVYLGRNWGMPMTRKQDPELVTSGPYQRVRHPIYTGLLLAVVGTGIGVAWYFLVAAVLAGAYFVYSARTEERNLASTFPDTYPAYRRSTKMLIPFVF